MGKLSFIHLSDIHFVKISGNSADIDQDLRDAILTDLEVNAKESLEKVVGVLVSGDIAFSGNKEEYEKAKEFLEKITDIFSINKSSVYCVPGNHDVDQSVPKRSSAVHESQCKLDSFDTLDETDIAFELKINDACYNDLLFKTTQKYNDFASMFGCNSHADMLNWVHSFSLGYNMKLNIHGMNSCFISNADDHKKVNENRLMYIGQAQIPKREKDAVVMLLCHHPPEFWKFRTDIEEKINKRADIQLYGHKHKQSISLTNDNIIITSGATHPVRGDGWNPRYNWITIECLVINNKSVIKVLIYPRILDKSRDRFIQDIEYCSDRNFIEHILSIDEKREKDLSDNYRVTIQNEIGNLRLEDNQVYRDKIDINLRDLIYKFFDLSYIKQTEILLELNLLEENDREMRYPELISKIINKAIQSNQMSKLWNEINKSSV